MKDKIVLPSEEFVIAGQSIQRLLPEYKVQEVCAYTGALYAGDFFVIARRNFAYILWKFGGTAYIDRETGCKYSGTQLIKVILEPGRKDKYGSEEHRVILEGGRFVKHRLYEPDRKTGKEVRETILEFLDLPLNFPIEDYLGYGFKYTLRFL